MVDFDLAQIRTADLLFADVTNKSAGVGIELGVAKENNKKIIKYHFLTYLLTSFNNSLV